MVFYVDFKAFPLTDSATDGNHTDLPGLEPTVQTLIFPVGIRVELGIVAVDLAGTYPNEAIPWHVLGCLAG